MSTEIQNTTSSQHDAKLPVLRSCPFCGGEAEIKQYAHNGLQVKCRSCLMGLKQKTLRYSLEWLKQKLIESWNARA